MYSLKIIIGFLVFILLVHIFASIIHLYWLIDWFDMPMHFLGGFGVAMMFGYLNHRFFKLQNFWTMAIMIVSLVALIGVFWELFEFSLDKIFLFKKWGPFQGGLSDTMGDLFFDLLGGIGFLIIDKVFRRNIIKDKS